MKLAFVSPRYGAEITSGAEHACRLLAEHAAQRHLVDVLTTCAREPNTWQNDYVEGVDRVRGVEVRRFVVNHSHSETGVRDLAAQIVAAGHGRADEQDWVRQLGPACPGLIDYLKQHHRAYDSVLFFSLYHATTVMGVTAVPERSVVFPYLRLDPPLRFSIWREILESAAGVGYVSPSEQALSHRFLRLRHANEEVVGIGVETPVQHTYPRLQQNPEDDVSEAADLDGGRERRSDAQGYLSDRGVPFRRRHRLYGTFALYGGRVQPDNGCEEMLEYFHGYAAANDEAALVLTGVKFMGIPAESYLRTPGVVPARDRMGAYEAADVALAPDPDDVLALPVLESMAVGTPVLTTARNAAGVDLCRHANAGLYYGNRDEFIEALRLLMNNASLRQRMGANGREYVRQHHRWDVVLGRLDRLTTRARGR